MAMRIEKVARVKGVLYDTETKSRDDYEDNKPKEKFEDVLRSAMKNRTHSSRGIPEAYKLEISRATQSLFYQGLATLQGVKSP